MRNDRSIGVSHGPANRSQVCALRIIRTTEAKKTAGYEEARDYCPCDSHIDSFSEKLTSRSKTAPGELGCQLALAYGSPRIGLRNFSLNGSRIFYHVC